MTPARERILERIRAANRRYRSDAGEAAPHAPRPALPDTPVATFIARVHAASATLQQLPTAELGAAVADYLEREALPEVTVASHPLLGELALPNAHRRPVQAGDLAGLTAAAAGIAETGSLVLPAGPESPRALLLLPDHLLVAVRQRDIVAHLEDAFDRLRASGSSSLPRAVNLITGPSRTADVEQVIQLGAHGPRRLHVFLLED